MPVLPKPRTKIVVTVGPTMNSPADIADAIESGASVFRLNFSHGTHAQHGENIRTIRKACEQVRRSVAILADLSGPKLRVGQVPDDAVELKRGEEIRLTSESGVVEKRRVSVNFPNVHELVKPGRRVLLDDGQVQLECERIDGLDLVCRVLDDSVLKSRKGVNLPGTYLPIPALTEKDRKDLAFALDHGVDFAALSFVRTVQDLQDARNAMQDYGRVVPLIAKIEMQAAVDVLSHIIEASDGVMVARGDLGVEIPVQEVPGVQQRIIRFCNEAGKPVITATQMLNSMIESPMPTRAEVTDVYNAIMQGTDAVMLSGETASGEYPLDSIRVMASIAREAEKDMQWSRFGTEESTGMGSVASSICSAAVHIAEELRADALLCASESGRTAMQVARFRPKCRIITYSTRQRTVNQLCLVWGVQSRMSRSVWDTEEESGPSAAIINVMIAAARDEGLVRPGMRVVVTGGLPLGLPGSTNFLQVVTVPE